MWEWIFGAYGVVIDVSEVLLYLYGVCLDVYVFTWVAFRDVNAF